MGFPEQLKKARISMGYTQQQVAAAMGLTSSTYCGYETGKRQPDVVKLKQLASVLHTTGNFLLETEPAEGTQDSRTSALPSVAEPYSRLNEGSRKIVDDLIQQLLRLQDDGQK